MPWKGRAAGSSHWSNEGETRRAWVQIPPAPPPSVGGVVPTNIAVVRSLDKDVRRAVKYTLDSLGLFWEEVEEPDPLRHSIAIFPESTEFVPITIPSIFIGETALSYYGGEKKEVENSPPEPASFFYVSKIRIPYFGVKYELNGDKLLRQAPLYAKDGNLLLGYDFFRNVSYFLKGGESSLKIRSIKSSDKRFNPQVLEEIRGTPPSIPIVDVHAKFLLSAILLLHKREGFPLIMKKVEPSGYNGALSISVPVFRTGRSRFRLNPFKKAESWVESLAKHADPLSFFVGRGDDYTPPKVKDLLLSLEENGHEVGLLASLRASIDHMTISDEYEELTSIIKRGNVGIRFKGIISTLIDAWKSAAYVQSSYVLAGELSTGIGFLLGMGYPFKPDDLVWNIPVIARVATTEFAKKVASFVAKWECIVDADALNDLSAISLVRNAQERGIWITTPVEMIERFKSVSEVKGVFRYDRKYLEGKMTAYSDIKDLQLRIISPEGKDIFLKVDLEGNRPKEVNVPV